MTHLPVGINLDSNLRRQHFWVVSQEEGHYRMLLRRNAFLEFGLVAFDCFSLLLQRGECAEYIVVVRREFCFAVGRPVGVDGWGEGPTCASLLFLFADCLEPLTLVVFTNCHASGPQQGLHRWHCGGFATLSLVGLRVGKQMRPERWRSLREL